MTARPPLLFGAFHTTVISFASGPPVTLETVGAPGNAHVPVTGDEYGPVPAELMAAISKSQPLTPRQVDLYFVLELFVTIGAPNAP